MAEEVRTCGDVDDALTAFVDGEAPAAAQAAIAAHLAACPACRARETAERSVRDLLHDRRGRICSHAPQTLRDRCAARSAAAAAATRSSLVRRWMPLSLAATLVLAVAGVFLFSVNDRAEALAAGLALDHAKCFALTDTRQTADAGASEQAWQSEHGWPVRVPATDSAEQLQLVSVRRCYSTDGKTCHMMYMWHGQPLSVYVLPHTAPTGAAVGAPLGHETAVWCDHDRTYAVVADGRPQDFDHIVAYVKGHAR
jgi:anti-sigma factor ChrR (cupin superfamily)